MVRSLEQSAGAPVGELDPSAQIDRVFRAAPPYEIELGGLSIRTDHRWFSSLPGGDPGAPVAELRRWPGDTVMALYAVAGAPSSKRTELPAIPGAAFGEAAQQLDPITKVWPGTLRTAAGEFRIEWVERAVEDSPTCLGALLVPGDAGLGDDVIDDLLLELRATFGRVEVNPAAWRLHVPQAPGKPLRLPLLGSPPGVKDEKTDPWQVVRGASFTLGLPPGVRARRLDGAIRAPVGVEGGKLWFRGRFLDSQGERVTIGDAHRAAYVAEFPAASEDWLTAARPPSGAADASRVNTQPFPIAAERSDALKARAERWRERGFAGEWLVFRLLFPENGVEIGLPVVEGARSPSLFWIPLTWRGAGRSPAPPPVDPAERFGIRFDRLTPAERKRQPWTEGTLIVPGLAADLPKGWFPAVALRSSDGYPIRILDSTGATVGKLTRLDGESRRPDPDAEGSPWRQVKRLGGGRTASVWRHSDGSYHFEGKDGQRFELSYNGGTDPQVAEMWRRLAESVRLTRPGP